MQSVLFKIYIYVHPSFCITSVLKEDKEIEKKKKRKGGRKGGIITFEFALFLLWALVLP